MWLEIFRFELRYHLKQPLFAISSAALFLISLLMVSTDVGVAFAGGPATAFRNGPMVIIQSCMILSILGLFVITAFVASTAQRDFELGTHELFFTKPVSKFHYLTGRLAGSLAVSMLVFTIASLGLIVAAFVPWQDPTRVTNVSLLSLLYGLLVIVLPNLLIMGTIFFTLTIWSRRMLLTYIGVVVFWFLQDEVETWALELQNPVLGALLDPIGSAALRIITRYWTISEFNTLIPGIGTGLLLNRLVWIGVAALVLWLGYWRFSYTRALKGRSTKVVAPEEVERFAAPTPIAQTARTFSLRTILSQISAQTRLETSLVLLALGLLFVLSFAYYHGQRLGTSLYPVTGMMLMVNQMNMSIFLTIIVIFFAGEVVWRERSSRQDGVFDSMPVPGGVYLAAKSLAMIMVVLAYNLTCVAGTIGFQLATGYTHLEPGLYAIGILLMATSAILIALLSVCVQSVVNNKFLGFLVMILVLAGVIALRRLDVIHGLILFPGRSWIMHSDMNGYGHLLAPFLWFKLYWGFAVASLLVLAAGLRTRGGEDTIRARWSGLRTHLRGPARWALGFTVAGFLATGAFVFYNTNVLNPFISPSVERKWQADYEHSFGQYRDLVQPRMTGVSTEVDIFPDERRVEIRGSYVLENQTDDSMYVVHVTLEPMLTINELLCDGQRENDGDPRLGYYIFDLAQPLPPGAKAELSFDLTAGNQGFVNNDPNDEIVANGTFITNHSYFPTVGYAAELELEGTRRRKKAGLPPAPRMKDRDDISGWQDNYISNQADWIDFEATVSTSSDQVALAPGYLQKEWEEDGRRYFRYEMDAPILDFFAFLSADYVVQRDAWNDVAIEVYYHADHHANVEHMISAVKASLDYYTTNFSPYQHRQVRIVEFPMYRLYAQAFPNTIPFSEGMGFITRVDEGDGVDYVFNTTAHEVAHQWWAHQVIGANVQGATMLSESLSEYSAMMVMEQRYGPDKLRHMLKYELDGYLDARSGETRVEMPLELVEDQSYIHYRKGCLTLYALRDYIGEANMNRALAAFLEETAFKGPPYPTSADLMSHFRAVTPDSLDYLLEDLFETITLYGNRTLDAEARQQEDGRWVVELDIECRKLLADGRGVESPIHMDEWIDIGIFGSEADGEPAVLFLEKRRVRSGAMTISITVDEEPVRAGIAPYHKLIDRETRDNVRKITRTSAP
jgi:ABC-type transport system involved in multi-copper enzyme maturation permease subunit